MKISLLISALCTLAFAYQPVYIHDIQGDGIRSPLENKKVQIEAVVTGSFTGSLELRGFFVQEEDGDADTNERTSEGIFVYSSEPVRVGDIVRIRAEVSEFHGLTELYHASIEILGNTDKLPSPVVSTLPYVNQYVQEFYEGMRVSFPQTLVVTDNYDLGRYGQLVLSAEQRLWQPAEITEPGSKAQRKQHRFNRLNKITLDDGLRKQNPDPGVYPTGGLSAQKTVRCGDEIHGLEGIVTYDRGRYMIEPTRPVVIKPVSSRQSAPKVGGDFKVASINVYNLFTTIDDGVKRCGPNGHVECRGADSDEEFERQLAKQIAVFRQIDADIFGIMELQNHKEQTAHAALAKALPGFDFIRNPGDGSLGGDAICVGLIYNTKTVQPIGKAQTVPDGYGQVLGTYKKRVVHSFDYFNRKPIMQTFRIKKSGETLSVAVAHLKSKGRKTTFARDKNQEDGQGNNNYTRTKGAEDLVAWIASKPTGVKADSVIIVGDFNAYSKEDPIRVLIKSGYAKIDHDYSYAFKGEWGALDHAFVSKNLLPRITGAEEWHINADEPHTIDYNTEYKRHGRIQRLYAPDPYRASDHDPLIIGIRSRK